MARMDGPIYMVSRHMRRAHVLVLATVYLAGAALALEPISFRSGLVQLEPGAKQLLAGHFVLQFESQPNSAERDALAASGIRLLSYLGSNAWFASTSAAKSASLPSGAVAVAAIETHWKHSPTLLTEPPPEWAVIHPAGKTDATAVVVYVQFFSDVSVESAHAALSKHDGHVQSLWDAANAATVELPQEQIESLADEDVVQWIEFALPAFESVNDGNRELTQVAIVDDPPYSLDGDGISVLVFDSGIADAAHPDFGGRLVARDEGEPASHSTHVAGTIGGSGANSVLHGGTPNQWRGMAPGISIESYAFGATGANIILYTDPGDIERDYADAVTNHGVEIANNSLSTNIALNGYSCELEGDYGLTPALIDAIVRGELGRPLCIVWAGGNERSRPRCGANYRTIPPPATAKNSLVVGAVRSNDDNVASFSSWGPTDDGRLRPDVCAPGAEYLSGVTSTEVGGGYSTKVGTSMAAPTVSGICALLLQDHRRAKGPAARLLPASYKAILAQTAADQGFHGPDYSYGYGSVRAKAAVDALRNDALREGIVDDGEVQLFTIEVTPALPELKVTLAWDDVPGTPNVIANLVNDLDIVAVSPSGVTHYPWVLDPAAPNTGAIQSVPDRVNNMEQVSVDRPEPGVWTLQISGHSIPEGPQTFSVVAQPGLRGCSNKPALTFSRAWYACGDMATVTLLDCNRNSQSGIRETAPVTISSTSAPEGRLLNLVETAENSGVFVGSIALSSPGDGSGLGVSSGDTITASFDDRQDLVTATTHSQVRCEAPNIVQVTHESSALRAFISVTTDVPTRISVLYGLDCGSLDARVSSPPYATSHELSLLDLEPETGYSFVVEATDQAGNKAFGDNNGICYSFVTDRLIDYYSELFAESDLDVQHGTLTLIPDDSLGGYAAHFARNLFRLPDDPIGHTPVTLDDDSSISVPLADGKSFVVYGDAYPALNIGSNGYIDVGAGNTNPSASFQEHFARAGISALRMDLDPSSQDGAGKILWNQYPDHFTVTWLGVQEWDKPGLLNTAQAQLYFDGRIVLSWLELDSKKGLIGISRGLGEPEEYRSSDLSAYPPQGLVLHRIGEQRAFEGSEFVLRAGADAPSATPTLSASGLPANATFVDVGEGIGELRWAVPNGFVGRVDGIEVTAGDGLDTRSETFGIAVEIGAGQPPVASAVSILPSSPDPWDDLTLSYSYFDLEGRSEGETSIQWTVNDTHVESLDGRRTVPTAFTEPGQVWQVHVQPNDGIQYGDTYASLPVTVMNPMDLNGNGVVDAADVQRSINATLGFAEVPEADVDGNGRVDATDLQLVVNYALR